MGREAPPIPSLHAERDSLSSRFDYLFEPLDDEEPVDDAIDALAVVGPAPTTAQRSPTDHRGGARTTRARTHPGAGRE